MLISMQRQPQPRVNLSVEKGNFRVMPVTGGVVVVEKDARRTGLLVGLGVDMVLQERTPHQIVGMVCTLQGKAV
jgi:hypothetical protein